MADGRSYRDLMCLSRGRRLPGRSRRTCIWQDNIEIDLKGMGLMGVEWIHMAQDWDKRRSVLKSITKIWVLKNAGNFLKSKNFQSLKKKSAAWL